MTNFLQLVLTSVFILCGTLQSVYADEWVLREKLHSKGFEDLLSSAIRAKSHDEHTVSFVVKRQNINELKDLLMQVSTPSHPLYGKHLTRDAVASLTSNVISSRKIVAYLKEHGAIIEKISQSEEIITARTTVATWEQMFNTEFFEYHHAEWSRGKVLRAKEYSLPAELDLHVGCVLHVTNFPSKTPRQPVNFIRPQAPLSTTSKNLRGEAAVTPASIRIHAGYAYPKLLKDFYEITAVGSTQTSIMIFETSNGEFFSPADLEAYQTAFDLPSQPIANFVGGTMMTEVVDQFRPANLDAAVTMAIGQNIPVSLYYSSTGDVLAFLYDIMNMPTIPDIVSFGSYIDYESHQSNSYLDEFEIVAIQLGVMGVTLIASSGNDGTSGYLAKSNRNACSYSPQFPASSPYVTTVSSTNGAEDRLGIEHANSNTGGGFSNYFAQPSYQQSVVDAYTSDTVFLTSEEVIEGYHSTGRAYPDLSGSSRNYLSVTTTGLYSSSGTENAVALITGIVGVLNSARAAEGLSKLGFLNPFLYANPGAFHDITIGVNRQTSITSTVNSISETSCDEGFVATTGWDPVSGLGTPIFPSLYSAALSHLPPTLAPTLAPTNAPLAT